MKRFKGLKRVDNYIKGYKLWQARLQAPGLSREDQVARFGISHTSLILIRTQEALLLEKEREKEDLETYRTVERIITHREGAEGEVEYFCKWTNLNYSSCTWELQKDVNPIAKEQIEDYRHREAEAKFPYKSVSYARNGRPTFQPMEKSPDYISETGCELKDFQLTGLNWLAYLWSQGQNGILADEMGLGKVRRQLVYYIYCSTVPSRLYSPFHFSPTFFMKCTSMVHFLWLFHCRLSLLGKCSFPYGRRISMSSHTLEIPPLAKLFAPMSSEHQINVSR